MTSDGRTSAMFGGGSSDSGTSLLQDRLWPRTNGGSSAAKVTRTLLHGKTVLNLRLGYDVCWRCYQTVLCEGLSESKRKTSSLIDDFNNWNRDTGSCDGSSNKLL